MRHAEATNVVWSLQMHEEQRQVARFQAQPEGLGPFFRLASLSVAFLGPPNHASSASPVEKMAASSGDDETSTDPNKINRFLSLSGIGLHPITGAGGSRGAAGLYRSVRCRP